LAKKKYGPFEGAKGMGKLVQPINMSIDSEGNKFVTDPIRGQVIAYDKDDKYVTAYGLPGKWKPVDAVPFGNLLYVADIKNGEIVVFDRKSGSVVRRFGQRGDANEILYKPTNPPLTRRDICISPMRGNSRYSRTTETAISSAD